MAKLLLILPRRSEPERLPETPSPGDFDLVPGAIILWAGSVARVIAGSPAGGVFEGEATLALLCVVLIPCWVLWSFIRSRWDEKKAKRPAGDGSSGIFTKS